MPHPLTDRDAGDDQIVFQGVLRTDNHQLPCYDADACRAFQEHQSQIPAKNMSRLPSEMLDHSAFTRGPRARSRRDGSRRHSTRGSTDDDSGEPEPEPSVAPRLCAICECDISHRNRGAETCGDKHRQEFYRRRNGIEPRDPYLTFVNDENRDEREELKNRAKAGCKCAARAVLDPIDGHCLKCGHRPPGPPPFYQRLWELFDRQPPFVTAHSPERQHDRILEAVAA